MRSITIKGLRFINVYEPSNHDIFFVGVSENTCQTSSIQCKEEIGVRCVNDDLNKILIYVRPNFTDKQVLEFETKLKNKHKILKVASPKVLRVINNPSKLLIEVSPRWSRNSVAHSYLATLIRIYIHDVLGWERNTKDINHLQISDKIVRLINIFGLRIFDVKPTKRYDVGMVVLTQLLESGKDIVGLSAGGILSKELIFNHPYLRLQHEYRKLK